MALSHYLVFFQFTLLAPLSISHNSGLVITNSLCFNLSENTFISPPTLQPSAFHLLVSNEKSVHYLIETPLYGISCFSLLFSRYIVFRELDCNRTGMGSFEFSLLELCCFLDGRGVRWHGPSASDWMLSFIMCTHVLVFLSFSPCP